MPRDTNSADDISTRYAFGDFELDTASQKLCRSGTEVPLRPQSYRVLVYLIRHPGKLVTKQELLDAVWGDTAVTDDSLTHCITDIRKALGDEDRSRVRTIPRRGYRFELPVSRLAPAPPAMIRTQENAASAPPSTGNRRYLNLLLLLIFLSGVGWLAFRYGTGNGAGDPKAAIALLPFMDLSEAQDQQYLADGVTEEILNLLAKNPDLRVIARTSSFAFRDGGHDLDTVAEKLDVSHILEGSVRKSGNELRITAQLIDVADQSHIWSEIYHRELDDLLAVQLEIAQAVATNLEVRLLRGAGTSPQPSRAGRAHERLLLGRFFFYRRLPGDLERAERYYREAVRIDPGYAPAWTGLAAAYLAQIFESGLDREEGFALMKEAVDKALTLDPTLPEAHIRTAAYYRYTGEWEKSETHWQKAVKLAPDNLLVLQVGAFKAFFRGDYPLALKKIRAALRQDPLARTLHEASGFMYMGAGDTETARKTLLHAQELAGGKSNSVELALTDIAIYQEQFEEARRRLAGLPDSDDKTAALALLWSRDGEAAKAREALAMLTRNAGPEMQIRIAEVHAGQGATEQAWQVLEASLEAPGIPGDVSGDFSGDFYCAKLHCSLFLRPLRTDPRWQKIIADACEYHFNLAPTDAGKEPRQSASL